MEIVNTNVDRGLLLFSNIFTTKDTRNLDLIDWFLAISVRGLSKFYHPPIGNFFSNVISIK